MVPSIIDSFGIIFFCFRKKDFMENYKKVVVFTPMQILEAEEKETKRIHEDMLKDMIDENTWMHYEEYKSNVNGVNLIENYNEQFSRAAYLSYEVGFSVLYETDSELMFYVGDFVTEEMIQYIRTKYEGENKYLGFGTFITEEDAQKKYYGVEVNEFKNYEEVFQELMQVLHVKLALRETKRTL